MNEDLEGLLRRTLQEQAGTVRGGAIVPQPSVVTPIRRRRTWVAPAAAAAVVVGLVAGATLLAKRDGSAQLGREGAVCSARPSTTWEQAYLAHPIPLNGHNIRLELISQRLGNEHLVVSSAPEPSRVYRVSDSGERHLLFSAPSGQVVADVRSSGPWVVVLTGFAFTDGLGYDAYTAITVLDTRTGGRKVIASSPVTETTKSDATLPRLDSLVVTHGSVFWVTRADGTTLRAEAHRYVLAKGTSSVISTQQGTNPQHVQQLDEVVPVLRDTVSALVWTTNRPSTTRVIARFALPQQVADDNPPGSTKDLVTDGTRYAWRDEKAISYWAPGLDEPKRFSGSRSAVEAVNGPLVQLLTSTEVGHAEVLDTRTGAVLALDDASRAFQGSYDGVALGAKQVAGASVYHATELYRVVVSQLPVLRC